MFGSHFTTSWYKPLYMSKYDKDVLDVLSQNKIKSTNQVLKELEKKVGKTINWHLLYRILVELEKKNKIERLEADAGFFWKRR